MHLKQKGFSPLSRTDFPLRKPQCNRVPLKTREARGATEKMPLDIGVPLKIGVPLQGWVPLMIGVQLRIGI